MLKTIRKPVHIGPKDHGRRMSLDEFDRAVGQDGFSYELSRGVIEVTNGPQLQHGLQVQEMRNQLVVYQVAHPGLICYLSASNDAKVLLGPVQSERHPDLSVYFEAPPGVDDVWSVWVPGIVIEVVSKSSIKRDYQDKPAEYLEFGIAEYWIVDSIKQQMTALVRWRGQWKPRVVKSFQKYTTQRMPGFSLDLKRIFAAAK